MYVESLGKLKNTLKYLFWYFYFSLEVVKKA